jgi:DNA-binding XRE family transcriptional regulator
MTDEFKKVKFVELRKQLGLTQLEMATILGVKQTEISRIESKKRIPQWVIRAIKLDTVMSKVGYRTMQIELE